MYRIVTVVGARPQFIKAAMMSREFLRSGLFNETIVHTGQHFDNNMSKLFFEELGIPAPKYNLGVSGGTHAQMTARMLIALEDVISEENPDMVLVYGDTNSTLAATLAAVKLKIPVCHAEAGPRTHVLSNPEEVNRICADHMSSVCCSPTPECQKNLVLENLESCSTFTGDLMYDSFLYWRRQLESRGCSYKTLDGLDCPLPSRYVYLTCHREENASDETLREVLSAASLLDVSVMYPVHPRVRERVISLSSEIGGLPDVRLVEPVGYLESLCLLDGCDFVITDSGGLQREAFFAGKCCVTLLPFPSCDELLVDGSNVLVPEITQKAISDAIKKTKPVDLNYRPFGNGHAAKEISHRMLEYLERK